MAKQSLIERQIKRLKIVLKYFIKRKEILQILKNVKNLDTIFIVQKNLQSLPRNSMIVRLKNRCWKTGRSRGFYRNFGISRHILREMANECLLPGLTKASW